MDLSPDERAALQMVPVAREIMADLRGRLPEGTDFGVMILVPGDNESRVVALTTDRDVVAPAVARWVMDVLDSQTKGQK